MSDERGRVMTSSPAEPDWREMAIDLARKSHDVDTYDACTCGEMETCCLACAAGVMWRNAYNDVLNTYEVWHVRIPGVAPDPPGMESAYDDGSDMTGSEES